MKSCTSIFLPLLFLLISFTAFGQTQKDLELKRSKTDRQIRKYNSLLKDVKGDKKRSETSFILLNKKLTARAAMIGYYNQEVALIEKEIVSLSEEKQRKEADMTILKKEYSDMLYYAYKNRSAFDKLSFIFSSDDFVQAYKRLKYIQDYALFRQQQAKLIKKAQDDIDAQVLKLEAKREEKQNLISQKRMERNQLIVEKQEREVVYRELKSKESELKKKLDKKKKERADLNKAIEELIRKLASRSKDSKTIPLSPEEKKLANGFTANKGKLPWPSESGLVKRGFGKSRHEIHNVDIINNGIDILVRKGDIARSVFEGVVEGVILLPGNKYSVLVRHGNYFTVYSNLDKPFVTNGEKVKTKQSIGAVKTIDDATVLHFEVWKSSDVVNPSAWILAR